MTISFAMTLAMGRNARTECSKLASCPPETRARLVGVTKEALSELFDQDTKFRLREGGYGAIAGAAAGATLGSPGQMLRNAAKGAIVGGLATAAVRKNPANQVYDAMGGYKLSGVAQDALDYITGAVTNKNDLLTGRQHAARLGTAGAAATAAAALTARSSLRDHQKDEATGLSRAQAAAAALPDSTTLSRAEKKLRTALANVSADHPKVRAAVDGAIVGVPVGVGGLVAFDPLVNARAVRKGYNL